jgi:hypothetical protein
MSHGGSSVYMVCGELTYNTHTHTPLHRAGFVLSVLSLTWGEM